MNVRIEMNTVSENLRKVTGITSDIPVLEQSVSTLNKVLCELKNPYKLFKDLYQRHAGDLNLRLSKFENYSGGRTWLESKVRVGTLRFKLSHCIDGNLHIYNTNDEPYNPLLINAIRNPIKMDYTVRNSGDRLHAGDVKEYLPLLAAKFEEIVTPLIDAYIEEATKDSILHNGVTLHNYNHHDSNFPMTVKFNSEWQLDNGRDFETICNKLNIPLEIQDWWYVLEISTIDDFCSFIKEFGSEDVDMNILNYLNKSDEKDLYFVSESFLSWDGVLILKNDSVYDSGEDENYEFLLRNPENLMNEVYNYLNIDIRDLEFRDYDGQYYYFCTENTGEIRYPIGRVFKLQGFFLEYNLPYKVDEEFMESIFENEGQKWVNAIPLILDGSQLNPYIREKILKTFIEEN